MTEIDIYQNADRNIDNDVDRDIEVDLEALRHGCQAIRDAADQTLRQGISDANGMIFRGLHIGERSQSGEVEAARRALAYAMERFWSNGIAHMERASRLVEFLEKVLSQYRTADDFATLDVRAVFAGLDEIARRRPAPPIPQTRGFVP